MPCTPTNEELNLTAYVSNLVAQEYFSRVEHNIWLVKKGSKDMPTHYNKSSVEDRVYLALLCF